MAKKRTSRKKTSNRRVAKKRVGASMRSRSASVRSGATGSSRGKRSRRRRVNIAAYAKKGARARQRVAGRTPGSTPLTELKSGKPWSSAAIRELRALAGENTPTRVIGMKIGKTPAAIYAKARELGLSLIPPNQPPNNPPNRGRSRSLARR